MRLPTTSGAKARVPVVPLASIVLLLAMFLFLAGNVQERDRTRTELPASAGRAEAATGAGCIVIAKGAGETVTYRFSDGEEATRPMGGPTDIYLAVRQVLSSNPSKPFVIKADAGVRYSYVDDVLERLRRAGVRELVLLTRRRLTGSAP